MENLGMENLFLNIINMSLTSGILIVIVLAVRMFLKKAPRWISCLLWGIVALRLVCPITIESTFSLMPLAEPVPKQITTMEEPQISTGFTILNDTVNPIIIDNFAPDETASANPMHIIVAAASQIWLSGIVIMLIYAVISYLRLLRTVYGAVPFRKQVKLCDYIETPFILGIFKPTIYVPSGLTREQFTHVIAHEKAHMKRLDHLWKPFGFLVLVIHWFNPLVWVAYVLLCKDIEIACDEKVVRDLEKEKAITYAQTLLECSQERRMVFMCPLAFGEVSVKERIRHILQFKKPAVWIAVAAVAACIVIAGCFLTNPKQENAQSDELQAGHSGQIQMGELLAGQNGQSQSSELPAGQNGAFDENQNVNGVSQIDVNALPIAGQDAGFDSLNRAVKQAIIARGTEKAPAAVPSQYAAASFAELGRVTTDGTIEEIWLYGVAMYMSANTSEEGIEETAGFQIPTVLRYEGVDGKYYLREYWEPGDGAYFETSIREKFPAEIAEQAIDAQQTVYQLTMDCFDQIVSLSALDTDSVINKLLDTICSVNSSAELASSSSTGAYIKNWPIEFRELLYYGQYTLKYKKLHFKTTEDLKAMVLNEACRQIDEIKRVVRTHPNTGEGLLETMTPADIHSVVKVTVVLDGDEVYSVQDADTVEHFENMLSGAVEVKGLECPCDIPIYIYRADGTVGIIYPATDSCDVFYSNGKYYDYGTEDNVKFWGLLGLKTEFGRVHNRDGKS